MAQNTYLARFLSGDDGESRVGILRNLTNVVGLLVFGVLSIILVQFVFILRLYKKKKS